MWLLHVLLGCQGGGIGEPTVSAQDPGTSVPTAPQPDGPFDPDHVMVVDASLTDANWGALTQETRSFFDLVVGPECLEGPVENVFTWYPGEVTVDGATVPEVGFRKKGLIGSLSWTRPSLKVDTDRFVDAQFFADDGEHLTLNNNNQDVSRLHTCLAYAVFDRAGAIAPRCHFATVGVNGEDLGVYSRVEPIKKRFLRDRFGSDDGDLYEGTISDFNDFLVTFDIKSEGSTLEPLEDVADALLLDDADLMPALQGLLELDGFITGWALEGLIAHWDGYAQGNNNFYVYRDAEDGLLHYLPWGADAVFEVPTSEALFTTGALVQRLWNHPEGQARYLAESQRLLDSVWDEAWLHEEVDRMEALVTPHALDPGAMAAGISGVRSFIDGRRATVQAVIDAPPSRPLFERQRECLQPIGSLSASFTTTWGSLAGDPFGNSATLQGDVMGTPIDSALIGAVAGDDGAGSRILAVVGVDASFTTALQVVLLLPQELEPGAWTIDIAAVTGVVIAADLANPNDPGEIVALMGGELVLEEADYSPGGTLRGTIEATLIPSIFF